MHAGYACGSVYAEAPGVAFLNVPSCNGQEETLTQPKEVAKPSDRTATGLHSSESPTDSCFEDPKSSVDPSKTEEARVSHIIVLRKGASLTASAWSVKKLDFEDIPCSILPRALTEPGMEDNIFRRTYFRLCLHCLDLVRHYLRWHQKHPESLTGTRRDSLTDLKALWTALQYQAKVNRSLSVEKIIVPTDSFLRRMKHATTQHTGPIWNLPRYLVDVLKAMPRESASSSPANETNNSGELTVPRKSGLHDASRVTGRSAIAALSATRRPSKARKLHSRLLELPPELLHTVMSYLSPRSLFHLHLTCHALAAQIPLDNRFWRDALLSDHLFGFLRQEPPRGYNELGQLGQLGQLAAHAEPPTSSVSDEDAGGPSDPARPCAVQSCAARPDAEPETYDWRALVQLLARCRNVESPRPLGGAPPAFRCRRFAWRNLELIERRVSIAEYWTQELKQDERSALDKAGEMTGQE